MSAESEARRLIRNVIHKFKFEELEQAVLPVFPELTWNHLRLGLIRAHETFSTAAAARFIDDVIEEKKIRAKVLKERVSTLQLIDTSRHSKRKVWTCYELRSKRREIDLQSCREIKDAVLERFNLNKQRTEVRVTAHDGITFLSVQEQPKQRPTSAIFFAFFSGQKYFFSSRKNAAKDYLTAVTYGLGYNNYRLQKLSGKDLNSLIQLLKAHQQNAIDSQNILQKPEFVVDRPVYRKSGINFSECEERRNYIDQCFGTDAPQIESFSVSCRDDRWSIELPPDLPPHSVGMMFDFKSRNIANMAKSLAERRVFSVPLPDYAQAMLITGRNEMKLQL